MREFKFVVVYYKTQGDLLRFECTALNTNHAVEVCKLYKGNSIAIHKVRRAFKERIRL